MPVYENLDERDLGGIYRSLCIDDNKLSQTEELSGFLARRLEEYTLCTIGRHVILRTIKAISNPWVRRMIQNTALMGLRSSQFTMERMAFPCLSLGRNPLRKYEGSIHLLAIRDSTWQICIYPHSNRGQGSMQVLCEIDENTFDFWKSFEWKGAWTEEAKDLVAEVLLGAGRDATGNWVPLRGAFQYLNILEGTPTPSLSACEALEYLRSMKNLDWGFAGRYCAEMPVVRDYVLDSLDIDPFAGYHASDFKHLMLYMDHAKYFVSPRHLGIVRDTMLEKIRLPGCRILNTTITWEEVIGSSFYYFSSSTYFLHSALVGYREPDQEIAFYNSEGKFDSKEARWKWGHYMTKDLSDSRRMVEGLYSFQENFDG